MVAINLTSLTCRAVALSALALSCSFMSFASLAAVLPEQRVDVLHHNYHGGGMVIDGPAVLVRKNMGETFSVAGHYLVDSVSAASIDVESFASPYEEERIEKSVSTDFLVDKTIYNLSYGTSNENDYDGKTYGVAVSQDFFGDLTSLSLGYAVGDDQVRNVADASFGETVDRQTFKVSLSQILSPVSMMGVTLEAISDEGYLNNPYRSVRYIDNSPGNTKGWSAESEVYPNTRHSNAIALTYAHYFDFDGSILAMYRYYSDSWDINGHSGQLEFRQRFNHWIFSAKIRAYEQSGASFYSDLFPFANAQSFLARDKELSDYSTLLLGVGVRYNMKPQLGFVKKAEIAVLFDRHMIDYQNFRDITASGFVAGSEPLYSFGANVVRFNGVIWF